MLESIMPDERSPPKSEESEKQRHEKSPDPSSLPPETQASEKSESAEDASRMSQSEDQRKKSKTTVVSDDEDNNEVLDGLLIDKRLKRNIPKCSRCQYKKVACHGGFPCRACTRSGYSEIECRTGTNKGDSSEEEYRKKRLAKMEGDDPFNGRGTKVGCSSRRGW